VIDGILLENILLANVTSKDGDTAVSILIEEEIKAIVDRIKSTDTRGRLQIFSLDKIQAGEEEKYSDFLARVRKLGIIPCLYVVPSSN